MGTARSVGARLWRRRSGPVAVRIGLGCAVIAAVCMAQLTSTSGADTSFNPGNATAGAVGISVAPTTGGLNYAVSLASSVADYENNEGQALSQTLDLGSIGASLYAPSCSNGAPSTIQQKDFPQPIQAESTNGNQTLTAVAEDALSSAPVGVGDESATATQTPSGSSTTTIASDNLAGLVNVTGVVTSAQASVVNGVTRLANATADISAVSLANGLVVLKGLHFVANQQTGAASSSTASFDISGLTIAGTNVPVTNDDATTVLQIINTALSPVGLQIDWPVVTTASDGTVAVSPLIVGIDNNTLGQEVIGVNLGKVETVRSALVADLFNVSCETETPVLVSDIGIGILAGGGNLNVDLGGANAVTNDSTFVSPFGPSGLPTSSTGPLDTSTLPSSDYIPPTAGIPATSGIIGTTTLPTSSVSGSGQKVSLGPTEKSESCRSIGPAGGGCNSSNVALPVGLIGLALLAALAAGDFARQRRRSRMAGLEA
jgi:hypothetical protein